MKIQRGTALVLFLCVLLGGCRAGRRGLPDYRTCDFRAEVRMDLGEGTAYAEILADRGEGATPATLREVRVLAPPSVAGIVLSCEDGTVMLSRDGIHTAAAGAVAFWEACALLCADGSLRSVCDTEWEGLVLDYAEITSDTRTVEIYRDPETGIPKRACEGGVALTVIRFEGIQART